MATKTEMRADYMAARTHGFKGDYLRWVSVQREKALRDLALGNPQAAGDFDWACRQMKEWLRKRGWPVKGYFL